jgi:hypothetical protein
MGRQRRVLGRTDGVEEAADFALLAPLTIAIRCEKCHIMGTAGGT